MISPRSPTRSGGKLAFPTSTEGPPSDAPERRPSGWRLMSGPSDGTSPRGVGASPQGVAPIRKSLVSRYYQLLSGHAAIGSFPHERMTGS